MNPNTDKWTEIEHLPEWDEEFYHVYTAKKHGKWLMLKTLRPELKGLPEYEDMIRKEFEVRYNLAHPHIIMINDLEEVPGLGLCIITDDVYGDSLAKLIKDGKVTGEHIFKLHHQLLDALDYIQENHLAHKPLNSSRVIFTENIGNLKLIDVGFEQKKVLTTVDTADDIYNYGVLLKEALDAVPDADPRLRRVAARCTDPNPARRYKSLNALRLALETRRTSLIYITIIIFLLAMIAILLWLVSVGR
ncbi:MAG: protein kinase [Muribaculaceae bacterium]|nr:protein kinase [Muribaculaceae bacterium]